MRLEAIAALNQGKRSSSLVAGAIAFSDVNELAKIALLARYHTDPAFVKRLEAIVLSSLVSRGCKHAEQLAPVIVDEIRRDPICKTCRGEASLMIGECKVLCPDCDGAGYTGRAGATLARAAGIPKTTFRRNGYKDICLKIIMLIETQIGEADRAFMSQ